MKRICQVLLGVAVTVAVLKAADPDLAVRCLRVGQGQVEGRLVGLEAGLIRLNTETGTRQLPLDGFREILFDGSPKPELPPPWTVWTRDGDRLMARRLGAAANDGGLMVEGYGWRATGLPLSGLRALASRAVMRADAERKEFERTRRDPPVGEDRLMVAREERHHIFSGVVEELTEEGVTAVLAGQRRVLPWEAVRWIVLAAGGEGTETPQGHLVLLGDGTRTDLSEVETGGPNLKGRDGGAHYRLEVSRISRLRVRSDRYRYLSDMEAREVRTRPLVDVAWRPRRDASALGGPLRLGGRTHPKGLGMHARTSMSFALEGSYRRFYATVGVDGAASRRGSVVFRVEGDGRGLLELGPLTGGDPPGPIEADVRGVQTLTLELDSGSPVVVSGNLGDWAAARVVR